MQYEILHNINLTPLATQHSIQWRKKKQGCSVMFEVSTVHFIGSLSINY